MPDCKTIYNIWRHFLNETGLWTLLKHTIIVFIVCLWSWNITEGFTTNDWQWRDPWVRKGSMKYVSYGLHFITPPPSDSGIFFHLMSIKVWRDHFTQSNPLIPSPSTNLEWQKFNSLSHIGVCTKHILKPTCLHIK